MKDIEILENMRDEIYGAMQFEDDYQVSELEEEQFNALNLAIKALKERQTDKEKIKELEANNYECNNRINDCIETINKIQEEFLKYDWKNSNNEQIYNQLKSLYNEIFKKTKENRK